MADNSATRFWAKVDIRANDECWPWIGYKNIDGYEDIAREFGVSQRAIRSIQRGEKWAWLTGAQRVS